MSQWTNKLRLVSHSPVRLWRHRERESDRGQLCERTSVKSGASIMHRAVYKRVVLYILYVLERRQPLQHVLSPPPGLHVGSHRKKSISYETPRKIPFIDDNIERENFNVCSLVTQQIQRRPKKIFLRLVIY